MGVIPGAPRHIAGDLDSSGPLVSKTRRRRGHRPTQAGDVPERELSPMSRKVKILFMQSCENPGRIACVALLRCLSGLVCILWWLQSLLTRVYLGRQH